MEELTYDRTREREMKEYKTEKTTTDKQKIKQKK
jgi:hypothetical protein